MIYYVALGISVVLNAGSLLLLKSYAVRVPGGAGRNPWLERLMDPRLIVSVVAYGLAAISWFVALLGVDLIVAYPTLSLTYVVIGLVAPRLFGEELSARKWAALSLIIAGVIVMNV